jgi:amino acid transporter
MGLLCVINIGSFKGLVRFNFVLFSFKVIVILITILWLIKTQFHVQNFQAIPNSNSSIWHAMLSAVATGGIAFAFTGFKHGVELAGETKNHKIAIPLAIVGSIICCLILYLGLQIAFLGAISPNDLSQGWQNLTFKGDVGPFAGIAASLGLIWLLKLLYIDAAISPLGAGLIYVTSTARILYAMSKSGFVPTIFSKLNKQHFPIFAIALNFVLGMFLFLPLPGWQAMVSFLVSAMVISYAMGPIALLCMRRQLPEEERTFKLPAATLLSLFAFYFCNLISYWTGWETIWKLDIAIGLGLLFFIFSYFKNTLPKQDLSLKALLWIAPYLIGMSIISYLGAFGGKNVLTFGWDFLVIGLFSMVILYLAVISRNGIIHEQYHLYKTEELAEPITLKL